MKRQQRTIGAIVKIPLKDGFHSYALVLDKASIAVYNLKTKSELTIEEVITYDTLFIIAVYNSAITSGHWPKIGKIS
jgi:Immunity protein 26